MPEASRELCPYRIAEDFGGAFSMGCVGGGVFQAISGFRNAPSGFYRRLLGSITAIKVRAPMIGGNFAIWGGTFSTIECALAHFRAMDDAWNSILSGFMTSGLLAARKGTKLSIISNAFVGGVIMAIIEIASNIKIRSNAYFNHSDNDARTMQTLDIFENTNVSSVNSERKFFDRHRK